MLMVCSIHLCEGDIAQGGGSERRDSYKQGVRCNDKEVYGRSCSKKRKSDKSVVNLEQLQVDQEEQVG